MSTQVAGPKKHVTIHELRRMKEAGERIATVTAYDPDAIGSLKEDVDGDLYVSGSGTLVRAMLADGLVDELHLFVYPLTRGSSPRLFAEEDAPGKFSLSACEPYENGVVHLAYQPQA